MPTVQDADALAERSHTGQVDKAGNPYIDHPRADRRRSPTPGGAMAGERAGGPAVVGVPVGVHQPTPMRRGPAMTPKLFGRGAKNPTEHSRRASVTSPELAPPTRESLAAGFAFARLLPDPDFRNRLKLLGHNGERVVVMRPDHTMADLFARTADYPRALVAVPDPDQPHGWALAWMERQ